MGGTGLFEEGVDLKFTPTWVVALVCTVIVAFSYGIVYSLHVLGKFLKRKKQEPLFKALQKVKTEFMLVGFISLFLAVTQNGITKICVPEKWTHHMLPCSLEDKEQEESKLSTSSTSQFQTFFSSNDVFDDPRLLFELDTGGTIPFLEETPGFCAAKGKVPLLSVEALHHLHVFIFIQAVTHVAVCVLTISFVGIIIRRWRHWEDSIVNEDNASHERTMTLVHQHEYISRHSKHSVAMGWVKSFFKQFYGPVVKLDYITLRHGFIMTHCRGNPKFNFHKYVNRALENDFRRFVGIDWYLWIFVVVFLLLNIKGWHTYFWISLFPFLILFAVGAKLEHVIIQLANEVSDDNPKAKIQCQLTVEPSDDHFWFNRPRLVLLLIHIILFQNSFEIAFVVWVFVTYGIDSCMMGRLQYIVIRLLIGASVQVLCSFSTLPLYAIVIQMGSHFKNVIFNEHIQEKLIGWAQKAKRKGLRGENDRSYEASLASKGSSPQHNVASKGSSPQNNGASTSSVSIQLGTLSRRSPPHEDNNTDTSSVSIQLETVSRRSPSHEDNNTDIVPCNDDNNTDIVPCNEDIV